MHQNNTDITEQRVRFVAKYYQPAAFDSRKAWQQMESRLHMAAPKRRSLVTFYRVAAAALVLVMGGILFFTGKTGETLVAKANHTQFTLPDSSRIEMQKGAKLEYDRKFGKAERRVSMSGEISFAVARNEEKPFVVSTPSAQIKVLGTEFAVIAHDKETHLSVTSGKVQFTPHSPVIPLLCTAGMSVHYTAHDETVKVTSPEGSMEIDEKNKSLTFNNTQLKDVALVLSHFYNVQIELPETEAEHTFTSSFTQKSVIEIINIINLTLDANLSIDD